MAGRLPLNAMQAFEAAARSGSFAAAAAELGVTAAAVSQHVRLLEDRFGKTLFLRQPSGVELTEAGRAFFLRLTGAFGDLAEAAEQVRAATARPRVVISVLPSVGELWLLPALARLADTSGLHIIEDEQDPVDFVAGGVDIRISYGTSAYPHLDPVVLFQDQMVPVASPGLAAGLTGGVAAAAEGQFIHTGWGPGSSNPQSWSQWHSAMALARRPEPGKGLAFARLASAAEAARLGMGLALLPRSLAAADIARGTLVAVGPPAALLPQPYVMIARPGARQRPGARLVWQHLLALANATG